MKVHLPYSKYLQVDPDVSGCDDYTLIAADSLESKETEPSRDISSDESGTGSTSSQFPDVAIDEAFPPEWDKVTNRYPDVGAVSCEYLTNIVAKGDVSPTPSTILPRAPPTTPATPKREIKLVTAGSSAADWFTHGFVGIVSKDFKS